MYGVGTHVGDETDRFSATNFHAFVKILSDTHCALSAEPERSCSLLLQGARCERRSWALLGFLASDLGDGVGRHFEVGLDRHGGRFVIDDRFAILVGHGCEIGVECELAGAGLSLEIDCYYPELDRVECFDFTFAVDDYSECYGLHSTRRKSTLNLAPKNRAEFVSNDSI